jgi:hypothetical protein
VPGGIALGGFDDDGNRTLIVPAMPLETRITHAALSKQTIENLQFANFLAVAQLVGAAQPLERYERVADDPPDLRVTLVGGTPLGVELTTLPASEVSRQRLAELRRIARGVGEKLASKPDLYPHLGGKSVYLAELGSDESRPPKLPGPKLDVLIDLLASELASDFRVGDGTTGPNAVSDVSRQQSTSAFPINKGQRVVTDYGIQVHHTGPASRPPVVHANVQVTLLLNVLRDRLIAAIESKDQAQNDVLLISTGLIDAHGYVAATDQFVLQALRDLRQTNSISIKPVHLNQIIFHQWNTPNALVLFSRPNGPVLIDPANWS